MGLPQLAVVDVLDLLERAPDARVLPAHAEVAIVKALHLRREPGRDMHAVGDVADGNGVRGLAGKERPPHLARDLAVQRRDGVGAARELQAEDGHAERFLVVGGIDAAEAHEILVSNAELLAQRPEVLLDQVRREAVVAGGHGRVGGEDDLAGNLHRGGFEVDALFLHTVADGLEDGEAAVAFVEVEHAGRDAHRLDGAETADTEQQLLTDAGARVASVEARSEFAVLGRVALNVGVEQEEIAAADLDLPNFCTDRPAAGPDLHDDGLAVGTDGGLHGELIDVGADVLLLLPSSLVEALQEVALAVEQPDADQRNVEVGGALDVVSGEHAEAARVDRQRLMQAELGGEVADWPRAQHASVRGAPGAVGVEVLALAAVTGVDAAVQDEFGGAALQLFERDLAEQRDWVLVELAPAGGIKIAEEGDTVLVPAPPEVAREGPEALLCGADEAVQRARLADHRGDLAGGFDQHTNLVLAEGARVLGLHDEDALQDAAVDERHAEKGVVQFFTGLLEVLEAGVVGDVGDGDGQDLFGDQAGEALVERHAQRADATRVQAERGGQHQVRPVGLQQVGGANVGAEAHGD